MGGRGHRTYDANVVADGGSGYIPTATYGPPRLGGAVIARPSVTPMLLASDAQLVVVTAPAGYGKTTAAALWDDAEARPFAWVRLDHLDNDPAHLLLHLVTAVDQVSTVDAATFRYLRGLGRAVDTQLVPAVVAALESAGPIVLVLDDVHELTHDAAVSALRALVQLAPESTTLTLIGRHAPPLDLARRRLQGSVLEIGPDQLKLSAAEAESALASVGAPVGSSAALVIERCEGWAAGVVMAGMALRDGASGDTITGRHRLVADYLMEEVLGRLDPELETFLVESAVLDHFSADDLNNVLQRDDSADLLGAIHASGNLFLVALDDQGVEYRYHRLFADLLRERLRNRDPARFRDVASRAAAHLERAGDLDGALLQALAADDPARAAALVERDAVRLGFDGRAGILERRLSLLDDHVFADYPDAAIARAWLGVTLGDAELIQRSLLLAAAADTGEALADGTASVKVAAALVGSLVGIGGVLEVVRHADTVCGAGDHLANPWWGAAASVRGAALSMIGDAENARATLESSLPVLDDLPGFRAVALAHLALLDLDDGALVRAAQASAQARSIVDSRDLCDLVPMVVVYAVDGLVRGHRGDAAGARDAVRSTERLLERLGDLAARTAALGHALTAATALEIDDPDLSRRHLDAGQLACRREPDAAAVQLRLVRVRELLAAHAQRGPRPALTAAELRLLPHLATHLSLQKIAAELHLGRETVKSQAKSIYRKLSVSSRTAAVTEAGRLGLLDRH
ncbi:helix-turn-helix transcriptional regulator [Mycolicibacterium aubagnense]|uniref:Helix-turn-helix transcriptional regulator n=1 Tax=Mycolicibacterium aubagnense TaxID=319707 RepID=A0ABM7II34_9MYCO|nr:helix-turn-helix transcriptional regulator [Mycolicibacterium aubagnense]